MEEKEKYSNLIERWKKGNFDSVKIIREIQQILMNCANWYEIFCVDGNRKPIAYCVNHCDDETLETYGKKAGVCFSDDVARNCIKAVLMEYAFLLVPWLLSDSEGVDLCVQVDFPIAYVTDGSGREQELFDVIIKLEKCSNVSGFCVSKVIPVM